MTSSAQLGTREKSRDAIVAQATQAAGVGSTAVTAEALRVLIASTGSMRGGWPGVCSRFREELAARPYLTPKQLDEVLGSERLARIASTAGIPVSAIRPLLAEVVSRLIREDVADAAGLNAALVRLGPARAVRRSGNARGVGLFVAALSLATLAWMILRSR